MNGVIDDTYELKKEGIKEEKTCRFKHHSLYMK